MIRRVLAKFSALSLLCPMLLFPRIIRGIAPDFDLMKNLSFLDSLGSGEGLYNSYRKTLCFDCEEKELLANVQSLAHNSPDSVLKKLGYSMPSAISNEDDSAPFEISCRCHRYYDFAAIVKHIAHFATTYSSNAPAVQNKDIKNEIAARALKSILEACSPELILFTLCLKKQELSLFVQYCFENFILIDSERLPRLIDLANNVIANWECTQDTAAWKIAAYSDAHKKRVFLYGMALRFSLGRHTGIAYHTSELMDICAHEAQETRMLKEFVYARVIFLTANTAFLVESAEQAHQIFSGVLQRVVADFDDFSSPVFKYIYRCLYRGKNTPEGLRWRLMVHVFCSVARDPDATAGNRGSNPDAIMMEMCNQCVKNEKFAHCLRDIIDQALEILGRHILKTIAGHDDAARNLHEMAVAMKMKLESMMEAMYARCKSGGGSLVAALDFMGIATKYNCFSRIGESIHSDLIAMAHGMTFETLLEEIGNASFVDPECAYNHIFRLINDGVFRDINSRDRFSIFEALFTQLNKNKSFADAVVVGYTLLKNKILSPKSPNFLVSDNSVSNGLVPGAYNFQRGYTSDYLRMYAVYLIKELENPETCVDALVPYIDEYRACIANRQDYLKSLWSGSSLYTNNCHLYGLDLYLRCLLAARTAHSGHLKQITLDSIPVIPKPLLYKYYDGMCIKVAHFIGSTSIPWVKGMADNALKCIYSEAILSGAIIKQQCIKAGASAPAKTALQLFVKTTSNLIVSDEMTSVVLFVKYLNMNHDFFPELLITQLKENCFIRETARDPSATKRSKFSAKRNAVQGDIDRALKSMHDAIQSVDQVILDMGKEIWDRWEAKAVMWLLVDRLSQTDYHLAISCYSSALEGKLLKLVDLILNKYAEASEKYRSMHVLSDLDYLEAFREMLSKTELLEGIVACTSDDDA